MMPIGPLMIEHRLIERVIAVMAREADRIEKEGRADPLFIDTVVDFIRTYADRSEHRKVMEELVGEHVRGRNTTKSLSQAGGRYAGGDRSALTDIARFMKELSSFYPSHIRKEDKSFFLPVMGYFTPEEKHAMLEEELEFDRNLIHERYRAVAEEAEARFA
jgi:hemerythrin-like domain-containing protein